jgi:hypothetical protein
VAARWLADVDDSPAPWRDMAGLPLVANVAAMIVKATRMPLSAGLSSARAGSAAVSGRSYRRRKRRRFGRPNRLCAVSADRRRNRVFREDPRRDSIASLSRRTPAMANGTATTATAQRASIFQIMAVLAFGQMRCTPDTHQPPWHAQDGRAH